MENLIEIILIAAVAFSASILTFFSGFGLRTLLLAAMLLFLPAASAIALTAVVHLINTIFISGLLLRFADARQALLFGIPSLAVLISGLKCWKP